MAELIRFRDLVSETDVAASNYIAQLLKSRIRTTPRALDD
jgi:hypothetical protein